MRSDESLLYSLFVRERFEAFIFLNSGIDALGEGW